MTASLAFGARTPRREVLRIGVRLDAQRPDLERGVAFGFTEAKRSASLFDWRVERVAADASCHAVVTAMPVDGAAAVPTLLLMYVSAPSANAFCLVAPEVTKESESGDRRMLLWHSSLEKFGAEQLNARYLAATGTRMTSDGWLGWFAIKLLTESVLRARTTNAETVAAYIRSASFDGHKGVPLSFDASRLLRQPLYEVVRDERTNTWRVDRELAPSDTGASR